MSAGDPWLARRALRWGASEVATLLVALGRRPLESLPSYLQPDAKVTRQSHGEPRIFAQKAGLVPPRKAGKSAVRGLELEERLALCWRDLVARGQAGWVCDTLDASTLVWVPRAFPREVLPLIDAACPELAATPDAFVRDTWGGLVCVDTKCSVKAYEGVKWHHVCQLTAQMAVCGADYSAIVEGEGWGAEWKDTAGEPAGPIRTYGVKRNQALIAEIRDAAREGWVRVERLRAQKEAA